MKNTPIQFFCYIPPGHQVSQREHGIYPI
jgi:hypothetical protein